MSKIGRTSAGYRWLDDLLIPLLGSINTALWVWPWANYMLASTPSAEPDRLQFWPIVAAIAIPAIGGRVLTSKLTVTQIPMRLFVAILALASALALAATQSHFVLISQPGAGSPMMHLAGLHATATQLALIAYAVGLTGLLTARGLRLAISELEGESAVRWFQVGIASWLVLLLALKGLPKGVEVAGTPLLATVMGAFLATGLLHLALVRRQQMDEETFRRAPAGPRSPWVILMGLLALGMVATALLIGALATNAARLTELVASRLASLAWAHGLLGISALWAALATALKGIGGSAGTQGQGPGALSPVLSYSQVWRLPNWPSLSPAGYLAGPLLGLAALLLLAAAAWFLRSYSNPELRVGREEIGRSSSWSWVGVLSYLWRRFTCLLKGRRTVTASGVLRQGEEPEVVGVRHLYRQALAWSGTKGRVRRDSETPYEYQGVLSSSVTGELAGRLTQAYVVNRYGDLNPTEEDLSALARDWRQATAEEPGSTGPRQ